MVARSQQLLCTGRWVYLCRTVTSHLCLFSSYHD